MLCRLTKRSRMRAAFALMAMYALCVVGSPLAVAFAGAMEALPCFTGEHHAGVVEASHADLHFGSGGHADHSGNHARSSGDRAHHDGMAHHPTGHSAPPNHGDDSQHKQRMGACCGVLCFTAVTNELSAPVRGPPHRSVIVEVLQINLSGRAPDRIDRPPSTTFMTS